MEASPVKSEPFLDPSWYLDTRANNHVTPNASVISVLTPYKGSTTVAMGNRQKLQIQITSNKNLSTKSHKFVLNNILHVPSASTNLLYVQRFAWDNNCRLIFDAN